MKPQEGIEGVSTGEYFSKRDTVNCGEDEGMLYDFLAEAKVEEIEIYGKEMIYQLGTVYARIWFMDLKICFLYLFSNPTLNISDAMLCCIQLKFFFFL